MATYLLNPPSATWCDPNAAQPLSGNPTQDFPWLYMPPNGVPFDFFGRIATPAAGAVETVVLEQLVPVGYDGVIKAVHHRFTGAGFVEGSGDLIWRIRIGSAGIVGKPVRNYSNMTVTFGEPANNRQVWGGIIFRSTEALVYTVTHAAASPIVPGGTFIICSMAGWLWPREGRTV